MKRFASIDPDLARDCFDYDPATGVLLWKVRKGPTMKARNTRFAGKVAGHVHTCTVGKKYLQVRVSDALHYGHRIAWVLMHGPIPEGMQVDHIDGNGINNRADNLRLVTASINKRNQRKLSNNTSGFTGVYASGKGWSARVWSEGKFHHLGYAPTREEAYAIRQAYNRDNGFHANHGVERPL